MKFPSKDFLDRIRSRYPKGARVELTHMEDVQAPSIGTRGTVRGVDDLGSILVDWDNGSRLNVVYGEDSCRKLDSVKVTCYGSTKTWDSRNEAEEFYLRVMTSSEGSEQSRYTKIYTELEMGLLECTDEE